MHRQSDIYNRVGFLEFSANDMFVFPEHIFLYIIKTLIFFYIRYQKMNLEKYVLRMTSKHLRMRGVRFMAENETSVISVIIVDVK